MEGPSGWNLISSIYHQSRSDTERFWSGSRAERWKHQPVDGCRGGRGTCGDTGDRLLWVGRTRLQNRKVALRLIHKSKGSHLIKTGRSFQ